jgi:tripartite ATP-independent transporter DctM subunit
VIYRNLSFSSLIRCLFDSAVTSGVILLLVGACAPFAWLITILDVPSVIVKVITGFTSNKYLILFFLNILLLIMGMVLDATANILILGPLLAPVAVAVGIHPLHFALLMIVNLIIGLGTPPVGTCLFATVPLAKISVERISRAILPFILTQFAVLFLITYFPPVVLFVPKLLGFVI